MDKTRSYSPRGSISGSVREDEAELAVQPTDRSPYGTIIGPALEPFKWTDEGDVRFLPSIDRKPPIKAFDPRAAREEELSNGAKHGPIRTGQPRLALIDPTG